jgi:uncharacterized RDD family membrane protein YckC
MIRQSPPATPAARVNCMQNRPPLMPPGGGYAMATPSNLASPGQRIVGGLIDFVILFVINGVFGVILQKTLGVGGIIVDLIMDVVYFAYFWSERGQSIGMMVFGFKVRDVATGQFPTVGAAALRGFIWIIEAFGTFCCLIGAIGWGWQLLDSRRQAVHDKIAGTIVTTS